MFEYSSKYKFTEEWFDHMIPTWEQVFENYDKEKIKNVLEIGCYEGRATIFLCEQVLQKGVNYDIVDTFGGTLEELYIHLEQKFPYNKFYLPKSLKHLQSRYD